MNQDLRTVGGSPPPCWDGQPAAFINADRPPASSAKQAHSSGFHAAPKNARKTLLIPEKSLLLERHSHKRSLGWTPGYKQHRTFRPGQAVATPEELEPVKTTSPIGLTPSPLPFGWVYPTLSSTGLWADLDHGPFPPLHLEARHFPNFRKSACFITCKRNTGARSHCCTV